MNENKQFNQRTRLHEKQKNIEGKEKSRIRIYNFDISVNSKSSHFNQNTADENFWAIFEWKRLMKNVLNEIKIYFLFSMF